ncbi:hypothetical protein [Aquimarina algiphila]|uniref:hypothetical protein n=1 Tax=Aquimarina algiphila TaxID=2047982 RepID=UPI0024916881|nr:hypothetical protein [Aquimarina algiphila]
MKSKGKGIQVLIILFLTILVGCGNDDDSSLSQEQDNTNLKTMLEEITKIAESVDCTNPDDWSFTSIGSKACGGPSGFIAYSLTIDTDDFLKKVETHKTAMKAFNKKWGIVSDCFVPATPIDVECVDGKAVLVFQ